LIASFGDRATEDLYHGRSTRRVSRFSREVADAALVKLDSLNAAASVLDLRARPAIALKP
jgi:proteic killer suppression protein